MVFRLSCQVYTAFDTHLDALGVYKLDTVGDAFVVVAGLDGFKSKEVSLFEEAIHTNLHYINTSYRVLVDNISRCSLLRIAPRESYNSLVCKERRRRGDRVQTVPNQKQASEEKLA